MSSVIAVPTRGTVSWRTARALNEIRDNSPGLPSIMWEENRLSVALCRNRLVMRFLLRTTADVLVFVDDDVIPPPDLLTYADWLADEDEDGYAVLGIPYPVFDGDQLGLSAWKIDGDGVHRFVRQKPGGVEEVDAVATGCMMIRRDILDRYSPDVFQIPSDPTAASLTDDWVFCAKAVRDGRRVGAVWPENGWLADHHRLAILPTPDHLKVER